MWREMRRRKQELSRQETADILARGTFGVLALHGDNGYPYAVPLNYVFRDGHIFFHCALEGHKMDAIRRNPHASFCVVDKDDVVPEEYTTYFRSAVAFGTIHVLDDDTQKRTAAELLGVRFAPEDAPEHLQETIDDAWARFVMLDFEIEHATGKEAIELVRRR